MNLSSQIEALLFFTGEPMRIRELAKTLSVPEEKVREAAAELKNSLMGHGITLMEHDDTVSLRTAPEASDLVARVQKESLEKDIGKAGLETLAIVLYQGPITRARIDHVRGVNSAFIVRQLMVRGLIERIDNPKDQRSFLYKPTLELLSFLGVSSIHELPDFESIQESLTTFETAQQETDTPHASAEPTTTTDHTSSE